MFYNSNFHIAYIGFTILCCIHCVEKGSDYYCCRHLILILNFLVSLNGEKVKFTVKQYLFIYLFNNDCVFRYLNKTDWIELSWNNTKHNQLVKKNKTSVSSQLNTFLFSARRILAGAVILLAAIWKENYRPWCDGDGLHWSLFKNCAREKQNVFPLAGFRHSHQLHQSHDGSAGGEDGRRRRGKQHAWDVQKCHLGFHVCLFGIGHVTCRLTGRQSVKTPLLFQSHRRRLVRVEVQKRGPQH